MRKTFLAAAVILMLGSLVKTQTIVTTPAAYFGFEPGADGKYAAWDQEVSYYEKVAKESDRVQISIVGKSTLGNPYLQLVITSPVNMAKLARYKEIARQLADPRGLTDQQIAALAQEGKAVVLVSLGQHSTEVASTQTGLVLVHHLLTGNDDKIKTILDNVILVLLPGINPDGHVMIADWMKKTAGTPYEGSGTPDLYQHYVGHDNNRDAYMLTQVESKLWNKVAREFSPQIYKDTHQQGSYSSRIYIPPKTDPVDPNVDPLIWRESMLLGGAMGTILEAEGVTGVESQVGSYTAWQIPTFHGMVNSRNIVGFHTESANARLIWPLYIHPDELQTDDRGRPIYAPQINFPHPWPGGWWRMGDIVRQQEIAILALLETAGRQREMFLRNIAFIARRQVRLGATQAPYAQIVPMRQHDSGTAMKLVATLMEAGVEVHRALENFNVGPMMFEAGDLVIREDQPLRAYIKTLLEPLIYPDNQWTRAADGTPYRPKDLASSNLGQLMGVDVISATEKITAKVEKLAAAPKMAGKITGTGTAGWLLTPTWNDSFRAVGRVLKTGGQVYRLRTPPAPWMPGTFWIPTGTATTTAAIDGLAKEFGLPFTAVAAQPVGPMMQLKPLRLGLLHRFSGGNPDEGWTRWIFDTWEVPYTRVEAAEIGKGGLKERFDVLLIPDDGVRSLMGSASASETAFPRGEESYPPEFRRGLGEAGIKALDEFAKAGGSLVLMNGACDLAIEKFGIPVENVLKNLTTREFFSPGSLLRVHFDTGHPLAYGMPSSTFLLGDDPPAFNVRSTLRNEAIAVVGRYPERDVRASGWLDGEAKIANRAALVEVKYGAGRLTLIGFGPQRRAQTHGTFKILFNALYQAGAEGVSDEGSTR